MSVQLLSSSGGSTEEPVPLARAEAVLCDMDGTLVDSSAVVESMWSSFARDYGMSERFDEIMAYSPGHTAALTAATASSTRYFFSSISVSVAPPTLITATSPVKAAWRFCKFFLV